MKSELETYVDRLAAELRKRGLTDPRIVEEARGHLTDAIERAVERGMPRDAAERDAVARFGAPDVIAANFAGSRHRVPNRVLLVLAAVVGLTIAYVDSRPGWDHTAVTAFSLLLSAAVIGFIGSERPWLWALAIGVWIPLHALVRAQSPDSLTMLLALTFPYAGACAGLLARRRHDASPVRSKVLHLQERTKRSYLMPQLTEPEARTHLVPVLERFGPELGGPSGAIESLTLLEESTDPQRHVRRYRAVFGNGTAITCTIAQSSDRRRRHISLEPAGTPPQRRA
jgi:hypothetical protein